MNDIITISQADVDITKPEAFAEFVRQAKALQNALDEAWGAVEQQMLDNSITGLKGDWGTISTIERINWKVNQSQVDPYYLKATPDTRKIKAAFDAGELPVGVDFTTSKYVTKRLK